MATNQTPSRSDTSADPVTRYARDVVEKKIIAGPDVRAACERHLKDLEDAHERGFRFDVEKAAHALDFFPLVLRLTGGKYEAKPFILLPWEQFVVGSLCGWVNIDDGKRRFRVAYVETGKGSGKSPLIGGLGIYGLVADKEPRAEIYAAATKREQAMILFRDAVAMVKMSPMLAKRLKTTGAAGREWNIAFAENGSFFRPIASDENGHSGPRVHMGLIDEVHEHKTDTVVEMLRAGTKSREQALIMMITNSGSDMNSVCWNYHEYAQRVCSGGMLDDSFFGFVCSLDVGDDPFADESCWEKVNPSLRDADLPGVKYLREQVTTAVGMPARESIVRRLNFCQWTQSSSPWIGYEIWKSCAHEPVDISTYKGRRCIAAMDLASTTDLASLVLAFEPENETQKWEIVPFFWTPEETIIDRERKDRVPYTQWVREGHLYKAPGKAISKLLILKKLIELHEMFIIEHLTYDRWRTEDLIALANDEGIKLPEMKAFGQGYKDMSPAVEETERMMLNGLVGHTHHPVLTWNAACATLESDAAGNRKLSKARSTGRIDGIVCMVMALGSTSKLKKPGYQMFFV